MRAPINAQGPYSILDYMECTCGNEDCDGDCGVSERYDPRDTDKFSWEDYDDKPI